MSLSVTVDHEDFPKGHEFSIHGLGIFENGKSKEISEDEEVAFMVFHRRTVRDALGENADVKVEGTTLVKGGIASILPPEEEISTVPEVTPPVVEEVEE